MHGGSINAPKIINWVKLLGVIAGANLKRDLRTFQDLIDIPGMNDTLVAYAEERINTLNVKAWETLTPKAIEVAPNPELSPYAFSPYPQVSIENLTYDMVRQMNVGAA